MNHPKLPVDNQAYWDQRFQVAQEQRRDPYTVVYDTDANTWYRIQEETRVILAQHLQRGDHFLDAGCGCGSVYPLVPRGVKYVGIDFCPNLIQLAQGYYRRGDFRVGRLENLPDIPDQYFTLALCRSLQGMYHVNLPSGAWDPIQKELRRVAKRTLILEYHDITNCHFID